MGVLYVRSGGQWEQVVAGTAGVAMTPWTNLTLLNGWTPESAGWVQPQYRKYGDNVQLRGSVVSAATSPAGQSLFTLPVGFRPPAAMRIGVVAHHGSTGAVYTGRVDFSGDGNFTIAGWDTTATNPVLYLNGIQFSVTA